MSLRCALIGCGRISPAHFGAIKDLPDISLSYVCDICEERAKKAADENGCKYVTDYKLLPLEEVDVVSIATPNHLHYEMAKYFLEKGKHVLVEKPLTINMDHLQDLEEIARDQGLHIFPVLQVRFNPVVEAVKEIVDTGAMGKMLSCNLIMHWNRPQEYFERDAWRGKREQDGGTFINQGIHYLDLLVWIMGDVKSLYAVTDTLNHNLEVEDHLSAILCFKSGAIGTVEFNVNTYPRNLECSIFLQGKKGSIKIGGTAADTLDIWEVEEVPRPILREGLSPNGYNGLYQGSCPNHIFVYKNMRDALLQGEKTAATDVRDAKKSLEVINAMYKSSKTHGEVFL